MYDCLFFPQEFFWVFSTVLATSQLKIAGNTGTLIVMKPITCSELMIELIYNEQSATTTTATAAAAATAKCCRSRTAFSYCWLDISDVMLAFDRIILNATEFCMLRGFLFAFRKLYQNYVASAIWCHLVLETCSFKSIETGSCAILFLNLSIGLAVCH